MKKNIYKIIIAGIAGAIVLASCKNKKFAPEGIQIVQPFDVNKYLGTWYEIARLDNKFEKNMIRVTANYSLKDDGKMKVVNKGFDTVKNKWKQAKGKAKFRGDKDVAAIKVSFFGPFYSGYNVIALNDNYQYALVAGEDLNYLWILSRYKTIPDAIKKNFLTVAQNAGYNTEKLIWVTH